MKKRVIFTSYDELSTDGRSYEDLAKSAMVDEYFDRLITNKREYADSIGARFICFIDEMKDFEVDTELEFTKVNLYKHYLFAKLSEEYDEVLYVDMDVVFNTHLNIFEEHNLNNGIHIKDMNSDIKDKSKSAMVNSRLGLRSPALKYHITKDLLDGQDNNVINTGIMLGKSEHIKQLHFVERMHEAIDKINKIKEASVFEKQYYPNNESIFSYILEKYKIPYVLLNDKWHQILDDRPKTIDGYCLHFINKQFNAFFKDKTQCAFSIHIEIPDDKLDNPSNYHGLEIPKSMMVKQQLLKYHDDLLNNHKEYCDNNNIHYMHFTRDEKYEEFYQRFPDLSEYDVINLYKIYLLDELTKEYDHVMYVDFDVYFKQQYNTFDYMPVDYLLCCKKSDKKDILIPTKNISLYFEHYSHDFRNPNTKYWNTHAMLVEEGLPGDNDVFNTGIVLASRYSMEKLDYFSDIDEVISLMKELKEDEYSLYHENLRSQFGYDNETIFSYKIEKNKVPHVDLHDSWHYINDLYKAKALQKDSLERTWAKNQYDAECKEHDVVLVHFISKNFGLAFDT